jgi:hypothetical protein
LVGHWTAHEAKANPGNRSHRISPNRSLQPGVFLSLLSGPATSKEDDDKPSKRGKDWNVCLHRNIAAVLGATQAA